MQSPVTEETSFCTLTNDSELELNAWQNAVKALSGKNNALHEQKQLLEDVIKHQQSEIDKLKLQNEFKE